MRVRTEEKRREIVEVAAKLFEENGYDRTSMSMISQRLGGSKATLYGYFKSKEELLLAALDYDVVERADELMQGFLNMKDLRQGLIGLGTAYLMRRLHSRVVSNVRIVSNQPEDSDIGGIFYGTVLRPAWMRLCEQFERMMDEGRLKRGDAWVMAMQWKGLCELDLFDRRLLGALREPDPKEIEAAATQAAEAFLQLYGTDPAGKSPPAAKQKQAKNAA